MRTAIGLETADWHLRRGSWRNRWHEIHGDSYYGLQQLVDIAIERELPLYAAGDLLDSYEQDDSEPLAVAFRAIDRLAEKKLPFYFVQGNHERVKHTPWLGLHLWPTHLHNRTIYKHGLNIFGLDQPHSDWIKGYYDRVPSSTDVLVTHLTWSDFMGEHINCEGRFSDVPHVKCMVTGDYHLHIAVRTVGKSGQDMLVLSPGATHITRLSEVENPAAYILYDDLTLEEVPLKSRKFYRTTLRSTEDLVALLDSFTSIEVPTVDLPRELANPILHVSYQVDIPNLYGKLSRACREKGLHLFLTPSEHYYRPRKKTDLDQVERSSEQIIAMGLSGNLFRVCNPASPEFKVTQRLLDSVNPEADLEVLEKEALS